MSVLVGIAALAVAIWGIGRFVLRGPDQSAYDLPPFELTGRQTGPSAEHVGIVQMLAAGAESMKQVKGRDRLKLMRRQMDHAGESLSFAGEIRPADAGGVPAEWVIASNVEDGRRLLYIHGGAHIAGSPRSHRAITMELSERARASVLAIDYRLMPEHTRRAGIADCQAGYVWILGNGPDGPSEVATLMVGGDSAGGNLALMTVAWARDAQLRAADAVVALSPATDSTLGSPSYQKNLTSDPIIGASFAHLANVPRTLMAWFTFLSNRINPSDPVMSPLLGNLAGLPPTLVHVSAAEMVLDDSVRYVNKAVAAGSVAVLGVWPCTLHVWHAFVRNMPEAQEAFDYIEDFLVAHTT